MRRFLHTLLVALLIAGLGLPANAEQFIGGAPQPQLTADLITSLEYKGTPTGGNATFTRGSARVFEDWEGVATRTTNVNEAVFKARRVANLLAADSSEDFSVASWGKQNSATVTGTNVLNFPAENDYVVQNVSTSGNPYGKTFVFSATLSGNGTASIGIYRYGGTGIYTKSITLTSTPTRYSVPITFSGIDTAGYSTRIFRPAGATATQVTATNAMLEEATGQTNQNPSEYVSTHQYYGGQVVKGVRYFDYENGNTVDANGVVTETAGAAIPEAQLTGYQYDGAATNKIASAYNAVGPDMPGSELITVEADRTFASDTGFWSKGVGWSIGSGVVTWTHGSGNGNLSRANLTTIGKRYRFYYDVIANTTTATLSILGLSGYTEISSTVGANKYIDFTASSVSLSLRAAGGAGGAYSIDNFSLKEIGAAKLDGTFASGLGTGAQNTAAATAAIPGMTVSGDAAGVLSIVSDSAKLATAKLTRLIPSGKVYKADNSTGIADMIIDMAGNLSAATHTISLFARGGSAADDDIKLGDVTTGVGAAIDLTDAYVLKSYTYTAAAAATRIIIPAGDTVYFCLMGSETGAVPTSRIIVEGAAASRSRDNLTIPVADGTNFRQREGTASVDVTWGFGSASVAADTYVFALAPSTTSNSLMYVYKPAVGNLSSRINDSTTSVINEIASFSAGESDTLKSTWSTAKNKINTFDGAGWGTAAAYDGAFVLGTDWNIALPASAKYPFALKNLRVLGTADPAGM